MKLRNKKTGRVVNFRHIAFDEPKDDRENYRYSSLAQFNEEWEDYKPAKPLIEDEAKRSVFKAWAEILGRDLEKADFKYDAERNSFNCYIADSTIEFANGEGINCVDREIYTFRALCGEEGEVTKQTPQGGMFEEEEC